MNLALRPSWRPEPVSTPLTLHAALSREAYQDLRRLGRPAEVEAVLTRLAAYKRPARTAAPDDLGDLDWVGGYHLAVGVLTRLFMDDVERPGAIVPNARYWHEEHAQRQRYGRRGLWVSARVSRAIYPEILRRRGGLTHSEHAVRLIRGT